MNIIQQYTGLGFLDQVVVLLLLIALLLCLIFTRMGGRRGDE